MSRTSVVPVLALLLSGCPAVDDTGDNPLFGDRRVEGIVDFEGHEDLEDYAFESTTPASNRYSSPDALGNYLLQLSFVSDEDAPSVNGTFVVGSDTGVVAPGVYPVAFAIPESGPFATATLALGNQDPVYSVTAIGANGTVTIDAIDEDGVHGSFELSGDAAWTAGTGANVFNLEGVFSEVPVNDI